MRRHAESTPCPAPPASFHTSNYFSHSHARRSSVYAPPGYGLDENTTTHLEYTTELQAGLRHVKPRRPARGTRPSAFNPSLDIFEDVAQEEEQEHAAVYVKRKSSVREHAGALSEAGVHKKSTILAHKAQKIHIRAPESQSRRISHLPVERSIPEPNATMQLQEHALEKRELRKQGPKKDPRRRTIYVPSDDTTIMTIHPGQASHVSRNSRHKSPDTGLELVTLSDEEAENLVSVLKKERKAPRKSLAAPPKRAPLLQSSRQAPSFSSDVVGQGGGKENVPPGMQVFEGKTGTHIQFNFTKDEPKQPATRPAKVHFNSKASDLSSTRPKAEGTKKRVRTQQSSDASPAKSMKAKADALASSARGTTTKPSVKTTKSRITKSGLLSSSPFHTDRSPPTALRRQRVERAPTTITLMHEVGKPQQPKEKYPVLSEDLARPDMYEDNWLTYQEVAITQLLNSMFKSASKISDEEEPSGELRRKMLQLYQEPAMPTLHKRLQASLQYGALSIPKHLLAQSVRLGEDVGLRKKFLNLWVKTYDLTSLRAAAETVVGRQITIPSRLSSGSTSSDDGSRLMRAERRAMENFLDAFLIRNEDAVRVKAGVGSIARIARGDQGDDFGSQAWSWRRTALRSLMLIHLLDRAKASDIIPGCLFQSTSTHKTSTDVLHALANMLLPSLGDVTRPLGHLNYSVEVAQYPLQEYTYHIDNIAIDLRDGVILTRLVELLLYSPTTLIARQEDTVTIAMPTGDVLTSAFDLSAKESWVLSQHLKFPSIGRAQKLYNVQIALAALCGVKGVPVQVVGGIKAEDIVDGHREKTLSLLWSLVGKHGLCSLVDWSQIVKEIGHFREAWYKKRDNYADGNLDSDSDEATDEIGGLEYYQRLLLSWARCIARTRGFRIANLTTSFSNPKVLEAIVDTYLPVTMSSATEGASQLSLAAKLKATGCSTSFIALFATSSTSARSIPSKDFTLLTLSFLASRLLPLRITHRAASTIQRAFRQRLLRRSIHNHIVKMRIAHACAAVAQTRERLTTAATIIQRRWKAVLEKRRVDLETQVLLFQSLARGWAIRRWASRATDGRVGGKKKARRMRGGW